MDGWELRRQPRPPDKGFNNKGNSGMDCLGWSELLIPGGTGRRPHCRGEGDSG